MSAPEWLVPGAEVVEFRSGRNGATARIEATTVARVLKRDVVLANGERYNVDRLRKSNGSWESPTELLPATDPTVLQARQANLRAAHRSKARDRADDLVRSLARDDVAGVGSALDALVPAVERWIKSSSTDGTPR